MIALAGVSENLGLDFMLLKEQMSLRLGAEQGGSPKSYSIPVVPT